MTTATRHVLRDVLKFVPTQVLVEDKQGKKRMHVEGTFSESDTATGNNRRYGRPIWEKHIGDRQSAFMKRVAEKKVLGMLEHPESEPNLKDASHLFEDFRLLPTGGVWGRALVLGTPSGKILEELFEVGVPVGASSRGEGVTEVAKDGIEDVQEDYDLETWDFVHTPALEGARAAPVKESLERARKESGKMKEVIQRAKAVVAEAEKKNLSALELPALTALHIELIEALSPLATSSEVEAAEMRGRLAGLGMQVSATIGEKSKTSGDKTAEQFNEQYPDAISAITALVDSLVKQNEKLTKELAEANGKEGSDVGKKFEAAKKLGEELVRRINREVRERQKLERKLGIAVSTLDKVMEAVRAKGLNRQVELLVGKIPGLRHVKEELLGATNMKQLREKVDTFTKLIDSSGQKEESTDSTSPREPLPPRKTKKGKRFTEDTTAGEARPKSFFGRLAKRGL